MIDPDVLRDRMRTDLRTAMKARDQDAVTALRTALAMLDNAEAVAPTGDVARGSEHVAGATAGVGATEAERRALSLDDVHALLGAQVAESEAEAIRYDALGQGEAADRLRAQAAALAPYLARAD